MCFRYLYGIRKYLHEKVVVEPPTKFSNKGLHRIPIFREGLLGKREDEQKCFLCHNEEFKLRI